MKIDKRIYKADKKEKLTVVCTYTIVLTLKQEEKSDIYYISEQ